MLSKKVQENEINCFKISIYSTIVLVILIAALAGTGIFLSNTLPKLF